MARNDDWDADPWAANRQRKRDTSAAGGTASLDTSFRGSVLSRQHVHSLGRLGGFGSGNRIFGNFLRLRDQVLLQIALQIGNQIHRIGIIHTSNRRTAGPRCRGSSGG